MKRKAQKPLQELGDGGQLAPTQGTQGDGQKQSKTKGEETMENLQFNPQSKTIEEEINKCKQNPGSYKEFKRLKYKQVVYKIDDTVLIRNQDDYNNDFVGKVQKIMLLDLPDILKPVVQVVWYYKKSDLPKKYATFMDSISESEVFLTEHVDYAFVDCINGLCEVLTYEEYDNLPRVKNNQFFTRAQFDIKKKKITPGIEEWEKHCLCMTPLNPDKKYIQCDVCNKWQHLDCVKLTQEEADQIDQYQCPNCAKK